MMLEPIIEKLLNFAIAIMIPVVVIWFVLVTVIMVLMVCWLIFV